MSLCLRHNHCLWTRTLSWTFGLTCLHIQSSIGSGRKNCVLWSLDFYFTFVIMPKACEMFFHTVIPTQYHQSEVSALPRQWHKLLGCLQKTRCCYHYQSRLIHYSAKTTSPLRFYFLITLTNQTVQFITLIESSRNSFLSQSTGLAWWECKSKTDERK